MGESDGLPVLAVLYDIGPKDWLNRGIPREYRLELMATHSPGDEILDYVRPFMDDPERSVLVEAFKHYPAQSDLSTFARKLVPDSKQVQVVDQTRARIIFKGQERRQAERLIVEEEFDRI